MTFSLFNKNAPNTQPRKKFPVVAKLQSERSYPVAGRVLPLKVWENPRAKRLTLRIETGGKGIRVTIPPRLSDRELEKFISQHHGWIESHISKMPVQTILQPGQLIPILGVDHLIIHQPEQRGITSQKTDGAGMPVLIVHGHIEHLKRRIADYLKQLARSEIQKLVLRHTATIGRSARKVSFKDTKSRWGSCSSAGDLSFSWRIIMAPPAIVNYLVAHETAHLIEMNHSAEFWKLCTKLCPDTSECRRWLKLNGSALHTISFT